MRVAIHYHSNLEHHRLWLDPFAAGVERCGDIANRAWDAIPRGAPVAVMWGHTARWKAVRADQQVRGRPYVVLERGYFADRMAWTSVGVNGLNGRAEFFNRNSPPDRWEPHAELMRDWNPGEEYVLLAGQVVGDSSLEGVDARAFWTEAVTRLRDVQPLPVLWRPHPLAVARGDTWMPPGAELAPDAELAELLERAACLVAWNSNSAVDAVLAGCPAIVMDPGSMAWPVAGHSLKEAATPPMPDRDQWACDLAYCQWSLEEIAAGLPWRHIRAGLEHGA